MRTAIKRRHRVLAALAATIAPVAMLAMATPHADAKIPAGSNLEIFLEGPNFTADPANALQTGLWGHEGPGGSAGGTTVSADLTDGGTQWTTLFDDPEYDSVGMAFVPTSADGSAEKPAVTAGETALEAFDWWIDLGPFNPIDGTNVTATDVGYTVSTKAEFDAWVADGKPDQQPDANLVYHDIFRSGSPVSVAPKGKSIYNRWAAGQNLSLVVFRYSSLNADGVPVIGADSIAGGKAITAWLSFTTGQNPNRAVATSGAYTVTSGTPDQITITNGSPLANGVVGKAYAATLASTGGVGTVSYAVTAGSLPPGVALAAATGKFSGIPKVPGTYVFKVTATDASTPAKKTGSKVFTLVIDPMTVNALALPHALIGKAYPTGVKLTAHGGKGTLHWSVVAGALPAGIKLSSTGAISGTATTAGTAHFTVQVTDSSTPTKNVATRAFALVVDPFSVNAATLPNGVVGKTYPFGVKLTTHGGKGTLHWSLVGGALPPGLKLSTTGGITGKPTTAGTYSFTVHVTDSAVPPNAANGGFTIIVS